MSRTWASETSLSSGAPVHGAEIYSVTISSGRISPRTRFVPFADLWIETNTDHIGAQVKIPGSAAPLGPESGPLNGTILWMMVADACRILSRKGIKVKVEGDEPELKGNRVPWIDTDEPLMDNYFDTVIRQLESIPSEIGELKKMAGMAVDTLLKGGTVYFYSRYYESLAGEAVGRRGGFIFAKGLSDGKIQGTSNDCVIMGTYAPDDEADLKNLDEMKKTRHESRLHRADQSRSQGSGRTYRIQRNGSPCRQNVRHVRPFSPIPGFDRKVCPTSGSMATSLLWVMSVRTRHGDDTQDGNHAPPSISTGALKFSVDHNAQMGAIASQRGY